MLPIAASTPGASPLSQPRASGGESYGAVPNGSRNQEPKSNLAAPAPAGAGAEAIARSAQSPAPGQPGLAEVVQAKIASSEPQTRPAVEDAAVEDAFEAPSLLKGRGAAEMAEGADQPTGTGVEPDSQALTRGGPAGVETTQSASAPEATRTPESGENEDVTQAAREGYAGGVVATADPVEPGLMRAA